MTKFESQFISTNRVTEPYIETRYALNPTDEDKQEIINRFLLQNPKLRNCRVTYVPAQIICKEPLTTP